jgi:Ca2+-binding RTX toxin-like protein
MPGLVPGMHVFATWQDDERPRALANAATSSSKAMPGDDGRRPCSPGDSANAETLARSHGRNGAERAKPQETIMPISVVGLAFNGTSGADNFTGSSGDDGFYMTADNYVTDHIDGGAGSDTIDYSRSAVGVDITLTDPTAAGGPSGGTVTADYFYSLTNPLTGQNIVFGHTQTVAELTNIENATGSNQADTIHGNSAANNLKGLDGNDFINGGGGNDIIDGGAGDDKIIGGLGRDILTGGSGHDIFAFHSAAESPAGAYDTITDFVHGEDRIDLSGFLKTAPDNHPLTFIGSGAFTGTPGQIDAVAAGDGYMVQVDVDGDRHADFAVEVHSTAPLQSSDFILT